MPGGRRAALVGAAGLAVALVVAGCGVPSQTAPTPISRGQVPAALAQPAPTTAVPPTPKGAVSLPDIYLVENNRLVAVPRQGVAPHSLDDVLTEELVTLEQGPTLAEASRGLRSAIGDEVSLGGHLLKGGQAVVDLSQQFSSVSGLDKVLALAQIVCSVNGIPGVHSVSFTLAGAPVAVPVANGLLVERPLVAADYANLLSTEAPGPSAR